MIGVLDQQEQGLKASEICGAHGISIPISHYWKSKYSEMDKSQLKNLKEMNANRGRIKKCIQNYLCYIIPAN